MADDPAELGFDTLAVHAGAEPDELTGAVSPPIYQTSTYAQDGVARPRRGYEYARSQNPTRERLEHVLSEELEARIDSALGYPTHDPHGDPIPNADLEWPK